MNGVTDFMSKDHRRLDDLLNNYQSKKTSEPDSAKNSFFDFKSGLERHIVWEEEILFPIFEEKTGMQGGPTNVMKMEHVQIKGLLESILGLILKGDFRTEPLEAQLAGILSSHNVKEENVLYPWIDQTLSVEEIEATLQKLQAAKPEKQDMAKPVRLEKIYE